MKRLKPLSAAILTFTAFSIGANNMSGFEQGTRPLSQRPLYCQWISSYGQIPHRPSFLLPNESEHGHLISTMKEELQEHLWTLHERLRPYRHRRIAFYELPAALMWPLEQKIESLSSELQEVAVVESWLNPNKLTDQPVLRALQKRKKLLNSELRDLKSLRLSDWEIYQLMVKAEPSASLPRLALKVEWQSQLWGPKVQVWPVWQEISTDSQQFRRASKEPYFELSGSMLSPSLKSSLQQGKLPPSFALYSPYLHKPPVVDVLPSGYVIWGDSWSNRSQTLGPPHLESQFTSAANVAVDALLDLGCLQNSPRLQELQELQELHQVNQSHLLHLNSSKQ